MLGNKIKKIREEIGMTQMQLASKVGVDNSLICKIESNNANPSLGTLEKIARGLGVTSSLLLQNDEYHVEVS